MKDFFLKISSLFMAFIVLFSTFSFTVNEHYCGDILKDSSIFFEAEKCEMEMNVEKPCTLHEVKKECCEDIVNVIEGQDELKITFDKLTFDEQLFIASFVNSYINLFDSLEEKVTAFSEYPPPLIVKPIYKLDETYLI